MFKFLKKKISEAIASFTKGAEDPAKTPPREKDIEFKEIDEVVAESPKKVQEAIKKTERVLEKEKKEAADLIAELAEVSQKEPAKREKKAAKKKEAQKPEQKPEEKEEFAEKAEEKGREKKEEPPEEKKGFFSRLTEKVTSAITTTTLSEEKFEELFWNLEMSLLEANVAVAVIEKIKQDLKHELVAGTHKRRSLEEIIKMSLRKSIEDLFTVELDLIHRIKDHIKKEPDKPFIIAFVGINGVGKTTTLAKVAKKLQDSGLSPVIAAADTFRAAAIEQLEEHAHKLGVKIIKHDYGSDAAAVCFDAIAHAKAKGLKVVLIDTAGRSNVNVNLMAELKKVIRVAHPDMTIFIGDAVTGNDAVEQAKQFNEAVGIDGIILAKADVDEKGGSAISVSHVTQKPILFLGVGQKYEDLEKFSKDIILENLGLV